MRKPPRLYVKAKERLTTKYPAPLNPLAPGYSESQTQCTLAQGFTPIAFDPSQYCASAKIQAGYQVGQPDAAGSKVFHMMHLPSMNVGNSNAVRNGVQVF